jgi:hypothetical protein
VHIGSIHLFNHCQIYVPCQLLCMHNYATLPVLNWGLIFIELNLDSLCFQDNALIIAVDDPPEDGLDSPLRLEKLANEVSLWIVFLVLYHCCPVFLSFDKQKVRLNKSLISSALIDVPLSR